MMGMGRGRRMWRGKVWERARRRGRGDIEVGVERGGDMMIVITRRDLSGDIDDMRMESGGDIVRDRDLETGTESGDIIDIAHIRGKETNPHEDAPARETDKQTATNLEDPTTNVLEVAIESTDVDRDQDHRIKTANVEKIDESNHFLGITPSSNSKNGDLVITSSSDPPQPSPQLEQASHKPSPSNSSRDPHPTPPLHSDTAQ